MDLDTPRTNGRGVYAGRGKGVNQRAARGMAFAGFILLAGQFDCAAPTAAGGGRYAKLEYPIGVWYDVEAALQADPRSTEERFQADFAAMSRLGLGTVLLRCVPDDRWSDVTAAAEAAGVQAVLPDPQVRFMTPAVSDAETDVDPHGAASRPAVPDRAVLNLRCAAGPDEAPSATTARWWRQFHAGLAQGLTGGIAFDQFRGPAETFDSLAAAGGGVSVERLATVKRIAARMRAWGPLLHRLDLQPPPIAEPAAAGLELALFARGPRRLLMLVNRSESRMLRTLLNLPREIGGLPAERLVEVPAEGGLELGEVARAGSGRIKLPLEIAAGEARLFEVFGPLSDRVSVGEQ